MCALVTGGFKRHSALPTNRAQAKRSLACRVHHQQEQETQQASRCPFAGLASFFTQIPPQASARPSPLHKIGAENAVTHTWLEAGFSGQNVPGRLVSGLQKLTHADDFLLEMSHELPQELELKKRAFDAPARRSQVVVAEDSSLAAQTEALQVFLEYLPRRYPALYTVREAPGGARHVHVRATGDEYCVDDFSHCPLELCARLVQEDLVLMREALGDDVQGQPGPQMAAPASHHKPDPPRYVMAAAAVVFSFVDLADKLSQPLPVIHAPVPGFASDLDRLLAKTFASLQPGAPVWRNNWGLADTGVLDQPLYGSEAALRSRSGPLPPASRWLKTEYQTLSRLPHSRAILFTIRTMVEPLPDLARAPGAAAVLATSLRGMSPAMRAYKGLPSQAAAEDVLAYLDELAAADERPLPH